MEGDLWIEPGGGPEQWRQLHKYTDGRPVRWICNYLDLLSNDAYLDLTGDQRSILHGLWLAFASSRARLRLDTRSLSRRLALRVTSAQMKRLEQAGWITLSVTPPLRERYGFVTFARPAKDRRGEELKDPNHETWSSLERPLNQPSSQADANGQPGTPFAIPSDVTRPFPWEREEATFNE